MPDGKTDPPSKAGDRAEQTDDDRLDQQRPRDLATAGADRAEQRVLPLALRGRDREHVVDHEHARHRAR